jgi:hypothetical protein
MYFSSCWYLYFFAEEIPDGYPGNEVCGESKGIGFDNTAQLFFLLKDIRVMSKKYKCTQTQLSRRIPVETWRVLILEIKFIFH